LVAGSVYFVPGSSQVFSPFSPKAKQSGTHSDITSFF
jgi:hypothetical protein